MYPRLLRQTVQEYKALASRHRWEINLIRRVLIIPFVVSPLLFFKTVIDSNPLALNSIIEVDEKSCTLAKAIVNANDSIDGHFFPECAPGNPQGADTIVLKNDVLLTTPFVPDYFGATGLPLVSSEITIEGNGHSIVRDHQVDDFRLLTNTGDGRLTIKNVILRRGTSGSFRVGGAIWNKGGDLTIINSTIHGNKASGGAGIFSGPGKLVLINSTISGNTAEQFGGGIAVDFGTVHIINSTITGNEVEAGFGGGITLNSISGIEVNITNSVISGNIAYSASTTPVVGSAEIHSADEGAIVSSYYNVFSHAELTTEKAFTGFIPDSNDINASSNSSTPYALDQILNTSLDFNGGSTLTHALVPHSPAIDFSPSSDCEGLTDQRGLLRNFDGDGLLSANECDTGAFEYGHEIPPTATPTLEPTMTTTPLPSPTTTITHTPEPSSTPTVIPTVPIDSWYVALPLILKAHN